MAVSKSTQVHILEVMSALLMSELGIELGSFRPEADLVDDLGLDSVDLYNFIMLLGDAFDLDIHPEQVSNFRTLDATAKVIEQLLWAVE